MRRSVDRRGERTARRRGARRGRALGIVAAGWLGLLASAGPPLAAAASEGAGTGGAAADAATVTTEEARPPVSPRWGIGWDGQSDGLLLRYRWRDVWQFGLAAGPADSKEHTDTREWDSDAPTDTAMTGMTEYRRESGWVRLTGGRRFWRQERLALSVDVGVSYRWAHAQNISRWPHYWDSTLDVQNNRETVDTDAWQISLGLRPSWAIGERFTVEWECGLVYSYDLEKRTQLTWHDVDPEHSRDEDDGTGHAFRSYGVLDYSELKLIFWF